MRNFERQFVLIRPLLKSICALGLTLLVIGCKPAVIAASNNPPQEVGVASVISREVRLSNEFNGRVAAVEYVDVRPRVTGYVDRFVFQEGDAVKRGQLLFAIDPRPYRDALESAKAGLDHARAVHGVAKIQEQRAQTLDSAKAISREEYDRIVTAAAAASADVSAVDASLEAARLNLEFTRVTAPIDGRVSSANITAGNLVSSANLLTTLVSDENTVRVVSWYDNEWGYACRLSDLAHYISECGDGETRPERMRVVEADRVHRSRMRVGAEPEMAPK